MQVVCECRPYCLLMLDDFKPNTNQSTPQTMTWLWFEIIWNVAPIQQFLLNYSDKSCIWHCFRILLEGLVSHLTVCITEVQPSWKRSIFKQVSGPLWLRQNIFDDLEENLTLSSPVGPHALWQEYIVLNVHCVLLQDAW